MWRQVLPLICACAVLDAAPVGQAADPRSTTWLVDNLISIGGHAVTVVGTPTVVETPLGRVVEFNGATDALFLDTNPLAGLERFTLELMFSPARGGPEEQRYLHLSQTGTDDHRALFELRMSPDDTWCLDAFLRFGAERLALMDRAVRHSAGAWHTVAMTYDGKVMSDFVDGKQIQSGALLFKPMGPGRTSIGVRQNRVSWFKGRIRLVRITADVLPPSRLVLVPSKP